jgi:hypothetical protein
MASRLFLMDPIMPFPCSIPRAAGANFPLIVIQSRCRLQIRLHLVPNFFSHLTYFLSFDTFYSFYFLRTAVQHVQQMSNMSNKQSLKWRQDYSAYAWTLCCSLADHGTKHLDIFSFDIFSLIRHLSFFPFLFCFENSCPTTVT